jgi:delta14-sterol reductase
VPRQIDDDKRCAAKYGELWQEYQRTVRYRIVPWLY